MGSHGLHDRVAVVGMGCTAFGDRWDSSVDDLLLAAANEALESAGLDLADVDAFWLGSVGNYSGLTLTRPLRIVNKPVTRLENLCATGSDAVRNAAYAVASGAFDVVMAIGVEKLKDSSHAGLFFAGPDTDGTDTTVTAPGLFSLLGPAYRGKYGVADAELRRALTHIAWKNHQGGARNAKAQFRTAVDKETIATAPVIAGDLRIFDCSGVADGAAAAILVRADDAGRYSGRPIYCKAMAFAASDGSGPTDPGYDYTTFPEVVASAQDAYRQAGVRDPRRELALAEVHDCFTPTELVLMEDLGFSGRGEAWQDVLAGVFDRDGELPVNPDGGLKSFGHPVGASGLRMLYEVWLQLRAEAHGRQVANDRRLALTQNCGGGPGAMVSSVTIWGVDYAG